MRWKLPLLALLVLVLSAATLVPTQINFDATFASPPAGKVNVFYVFHDALSTGACAGGGSSYAICLWNGSSWVPIGGGGGSGGTINNAPQYDTPYYSLVGTANWLSGVALSGIPTLSTSAAPTLASAHNLAAPLLCSDTSFSATAQACSTAPSFAPAYGDSILYTASASNSGHLTLNVNGSGAIAVFKWQGVLLIAGDVQPNSQMLLTYSLAGGAGPAWVLYAPGNTPLTTGFDIGHAFACTGAGSGTAQTCTTSPSFVTLSYAGVAVFLQPSATNTGDVTLNVNATGAIHIRKNQGAAVLSAGDLVLGSGLFLTYDGTYWEVPGISPAPGSATTVTVNISNSQVLALSATPITLVAAQGAGTLVEVTSVALEYVYSSPAFSGGTGYSIAPQYGSTGVTACQTEPEGLLLNSTSSQIAVLAGDGFTLGASSQVLNTAVMLTAGTAVTSGGGSLIAHVTYRVHTGF